MQVFDNDDMARTLWTDDDTDTNELNEYQQKAIRQALTNNFQLIQGPPGLTKTQSLLLMRYCQIQVLVRVRLVLTLRTYLLKGTTAISVLCTVLLPTRQWMLYIVSCICT